MNFVNFIENYQLCSKCNKEMTSSSNKYCKNCKTKREYNRNLEKGLSKKYLNKFESKNSLHNKVTLEWTEASGINIYFIVLNRLILFRNVVLFIKI
jgi:NMD protein affecting ribosome stability and mRNA decay